MLEDQVLPGTFESVANVSLPHVVVTLWDPVSPPTWGVQAIYHIVTIFFKTSAPLLYSRAATSWRLLRGAYHMFPYPQGGRHLSATRCPSYVQVSPVKVCLSGSAEFLEESDPPELEAPSMEPLHCRFLAVCLISIQSMSRWNRSGESAALSIVFQDVHSYSLEPEFTLLEGLRGLAITSLPFPPHTAPADENAVDRLTCLRKRSGIFLSNSYNTSRYLYHI